MPPPAYPGNVRNDREQATFDLVNAERVKAGLAPLRWQNQLAAAAQKYADLLASTGQVGHFVGGTTPAERIQAMGYARYYAVGENAYEGLVGPFMEPDGAVLAWMHSPEHRDNILLPDFTETGIGVAVDASFNVYYVQEFAIAP